MGPASADEAEASASPQARFAPPYSDRGLDADQDGQFDFLAVDVNLAVEVAGEYLLSGGLYGSGNVTIASASDSPQLDVGTQTVRLLFDGVAINASGMDGAYRVDLTLEWMDDPVDFDTHMTAPYEHASFESPLAHFAPPHSEEGVDDDGDGLFDFLVVDARVTAETSGRYVFRGWAHDPNGTLRLIVDQDVNLSLGTQSIRFSFDGMKINASGVDGPYVVDLWLFTPDHRHSDFDTLQTVPYRASDFNGEPWSRVTVPATGSLPHAYQGPPTVPEVALKRVQVVDLSRA